MVVVGPFQLKYSILLLEALWIELVTINVNDFFRG